MPAVLDMSALCAWVHSFGTARYTLAQGLCEGTPVAARDAASEFHKASLCLSCSAVHAGSALRGLLTCTLRGAHAHLKACSPAC